MYSKPIKSLLIFFIACFAFTTVFATVPAGYYYFAKNKKKADLKTALHNICGPLFEFDYGGGAGFTWQGFYYTDRNQVDNTVIDMYSDSVRHFNGFAAVNGMNIEHSFPKSWWGAYPNNAYKDLFHLYPADGITNIVKNNLPLGEVTGTPSLNNGKSKVGTNGFETDYTDKCFEPADEFKGDFARSYFYIASIYENLAPLMQSPMVINNSTYPFWKPWAIDLLLKWNKQDPVSDKERTRIETIYGIQGNRNPFIDYPDLAEYIWGADSTKVYPFPDETEPFLVTPRRGNSIDFGVILQNDVRTQQLHIMGANINTDLQVSLIKGSSTLALSSPTISASNAIAGIDLGITFTPTTSGFVRDTLLIQGGGLTESLKIPIKALASSDFITLEPTDVSPVGGTLQWISDPVATNYNLNVYQGDQQAGDLIISTYVDGSSWNKALEIYNGTGKTVDLSSYSLQKQSNGAGYFGSTYKLSGTLADGKSVVLVHKSCNTPGLIAKATILTDSILSFNGNDAVQLVHSGVTIDMVGQANAGADVIWGYQLTLQRKASITHPASTFNQAEWDVLANDSYNMLGSHVMTFAVSNNYVLKDVLTGKTTSYLIQNLNPANTYTYSLQAIRPDGNKAAINTMQLHTSSLDSPEITDASDITHNQFTANWGETAYATGYLLDVFKVTGQADTIEVEGFDKVGSNGTPLPTGWTGNVSGIYTTSTSYGIATPSLNPKNKGEWVQTKTYPNPISKLTLMYRFASASTGSSILLDGLSNGSWTRVDSIPYKNTTKTYPVYTFTKSQGMNAFKFTYNKVGSGNLAIDDVSVTYGSTDTVYVTKDKVCPLNYSLVSNLSENTQYFYRVRATLNNSVSATSETIGVKTLISSKNQDINSSKIKIMTLRAQIHISGLQGDENIQIYSLTGICLYHAKATSTEKNITFNPSGIYIIRIQDKMNAYTGKVLK